jgi:hypothetical protein
LARDEVRTRNIKKSQEIVKICKKGLHTYADSDKQCFACLAIWRQAHKAETNAKRKEYVKTNKELVAAQQKASKLKNKDKAKITQKVYRKANRPKLTALQVKREAAKKQRTPPWLTEQHYKQIEMFYKAAADLTKEFGFQIDVDHIIPLQGKIVSGLHVPWNLQLLPHDQNMSKGNRI